MSVFCKGCNARDRELDRMSGVIAEVEVCNDLLRNQVKRLTKALEEASTLGNEMAVIATALSRSEREVRSA